MKNLRSLFLGLTVIMGMQSSLFSQLDNVSFLEVGKGNIKDAEALFEKYLTPYANIFGANLNSGWYNSAKPHKLGGFDLTLTFNTAWAPPVDRTFDASKLVLGEGANLLPNSEGTFISPTIAGKLDAASPKLEYSMPINNVPVTFAEFELPKGTGVNMIPLPMAQLTIGLPFGTDVSVRYLPTLPLGEAGEIGLWGVGGRHSIIQHIPALKKLPIIDITAQGGYTKLTTTANIDYQPTNLVAADHVLVTNANQFADQKLQMTASAWTVNLIFSETLPVISFYQGIGVSNSVVELGVNGKYPFPSIATSGEFAGEIVVTDNDLITDPIQLEMKNDMALRLNAGLRLKLGVLTIQFDYTKANYSVFTTGLGISFR